MSLEARMIKVLQFASMAQGTWIFPLSSEKRKKLKPKLKLEFRKMQNNSHSHSGLPQSESSSRDNSAGEVGFHGRRCE